MHKLNKSLSRKHLTGSAPYRLYRLTPDHFYVLDEDAAIDKRVPADPTGPIT